MANREIYREAIEEFLNGIDFEEEPLLLIHYRPGRGEGLKTLAINIGEEGKKWMGRLLHTEGEVRDLQRTN